MLDMFKNSGMFQTDSSFIKCAKVGDVFKFSCIDAGTNDSCWESHYYSTLADKLEVALVEYIAELATDKKVYKPTDIYFQGKRVLTLAPTSDA